MNANRMPGMDIFMDQDGVRRIDVLSAHEVPRFVAADRNCADIERTVVRTDVRELGTITRVTGEVESMMSADDGPTSPQRPVAI